MLVFLFGLGYGCGRGALDLGSIAPLGDLILAWSLVVLSGVWHCYEMNVWMSTVYRPRIAMDGVVHQGNC